MKSKSNSKTLSQVPTINKTSLLLSKPYQKTKAHNISQNLNPKTSCLDLSYSKIKTTMGIQKYKNLQIINLNGNNIEDFSSLKPLMYCNKLKVLQIQDNPISGKVNYIYGIYCAINRVIVINGIKVYDNLQAILQRQNNNGYKIALFLLQSCGIFNNILKKNYKTNYNKLLHELKQMQIHLKFNQQINSNQLLYTVNESIYNHFPLKSIPIPDHSDDDIKDTNDYFIQKLIQCKTTSQNNFIYKILSSIEVSDQLQQKQLQNQIEVTKLIIKDKIQKQYLFYQQITDNLQKNNINDKTQRNMKHLISAQTALETIDTATRYRNSEKYFGIHFSMDLQYIQQARKVILNQIQRLIFVVGEQLLKDKTKLIKQQSNMLNSPFMPTLTQLKSYQTEYQLQPFSSPKRVYNNSSILINILSSLENSLKRIVFRKIKNCRSRNETTQTFQLIQNCLCNSINDRYGFGFSKIMQNMMFQNEIILSAQKIKTKKLFMAWKNLKKRKLKILKNIIKRKIKADTFLIAIALTRWKMNSRADRLKRMASAALLSTKIYSLPKSKKGIQLAYQRTISNKLKKY